MKGFGRKLLVFVVGSLIADFTFDALMHIMDGKDILGNKVERNKTKVDWKGRIHLGRDEYQVV